MEDIAQNYTSDCFSYIPEIRTIVLVQSLQKPWPQNNINLPSQKICMLIVGKEAGTLSTLYGIANYAEKKTTRKIVSSNRCHRLVAVSLITTFAQV